MIILQVILWILTGYLAFNGLYIFLYAVASLFKYKPKTANGRTLPAFAILIPVYQEDNLILKTVKSFQSVQYPKDKFTLWIAADSLQVETIEKLEKDARVFPVLLGKKRTKSKALFQLTQQLKLEQSQPDLILILDVDNQIAPDFLHHMAGSYHYGYQAIQGNRIVHPSTSPLGILGDLSSIINNKIFRKGHRVLGLSSSLSGSGMAFSTSVFMEMLHDINLEFSGEDKLMEFYLLSRKIRIEYLEEAKVKDDTVESSASFIHQKQRWLYAQIYSSRRIFSAIKALILHGNTDLFDKGLQMLLLPRILFFGFTFLGALVSIWHLPSLISLIWLILLALAIISALIVIPGSFLKKITLRSVFMIPVAFLLMIIALIKSKKASKSFLHTSHKT